MTDASTGMSGNMCANEAELVAPPNARRRPVGGYATARRWGLVMLLSGIAFATYGSLVPFDFQTVPGDSVFAFVRTAPQRLSYQSGHIDFFANICLFVPIGFGGLAFVARNERSLRVVFQVLIITAAAGVLSLANECLQVMLPTRTASVADVVAQLIGTLVGCAAWIIFGRRIRGWLSQLETADRGPQRLELLLQGYFVFQFCMSVFPLDITVDPADLYHKLGRGQINLVPFAGHTWTSELAAEMLFFGFTCIPYGALATRLGMPSRTQLRSFGDSMSLGLAMVVGIELCQLFVASRFTDATQIVVGAAGVTIGVILMHAFWPQHATSSASQRRLLQTPGTWVFAAILYTFVPLAFLLWPFEFAFDAALARQEFHAMMRIPFDQMLGDSPLPFQTVLLRDMVLFFPLGLLLGAAVRCARGSWRRLMLVASMVGVLLVSFSIEVLQTVVPSRCADVTNVLVSSLAGALGIAALAFRPALSSEPAAPEEVAARSLQ